MEKNIQWYWENWTGRESKPDKGPGLQASFCLLNNTVSIFRHTAEPSHRRSEGLGHALNTIIPGISSVCLLPPFFPFTVTLEVSPRRNSGRDKACPGKEIIPAFWQPAPGEPLPDAGVRPRESPFQEPLWAVCCLEMVILPQVRSPCNSALGFLHSSAFSSGPLPFQS